MQISKMTDAALDVCLYQAAQAFGVFSIENPQDTLARQLELRRKISAISGLLDSIDRAIDVRVDGAFAHEDSAQVKF